MKDKLYKLMNWPEIEAIVYGEEGRPQEILGRHNVSTYTLFQTFQPYAKQVTLVTEEDDKEYTMELADEAGFYAIALIGKVKGSYYYMVTDIEGNKHKYYDPYDYPVNLKKDEISRWNKGILYNAGDILGSTVKSVLKTKGVLFRVWAPNAIRVSVVGEFNRWNGKSHPMMKDDATGIYSLFIPGLEAGAQYKYELSVKGGRIFTKVDPYATESMNGNSVVGTSKTFKWNDSDYLASASSVDRSKTPLSIYETELTGLVDDKGAVITDSLTDLIGRAGALGMNYVQFITDTEEAYGLMDGVSDEAMKTIVSSLHSSGLGAIYEWNPCAFSMKEDGLNDYDGTCLYGYGDERKRLNPAFNGFNYDYSRPEVTSYLLSGAFYLMNEYHLDGLHIDGISSILYLDYGKYEGEWAVNMYGGHENLDAVEFVKHFNSVMHKEYPYAITTTKEVCAFPKVTDDLNNEGLGFDLIWNNGFSEDYLGFIKGTDAFHNLNRITDSMNYEYCENYILTMSKEDVIAANEYDELRVNKGASYFDYIPVDDKNKPAVRRATLGFIMARPGKKLIYAGQEDKATLEALGRIYRENSALYSLDRNPYGFEWVNAINRGDGVLAFVRRDEYLNHSILVVCNFSSESYPEYKFGVPYEGKYKMIFTSDDKKLGGKSTVTVKPRETEEDAYDGRNNSLTLKLPAMSVSYYAFTPYTEEELLAIADEKVKKFKEQLEKEAKAKAKALAKKSSK